MSKFDDFINSLNIEGLTGEMKGQLKYLEGFCKDLDFKDQDIIDIQNKVKENLEKLNDE